MQSMPKRTFLKLSVAAAATAALAACGGGDECHRGYRRGASGSTAVQHPGRSGRRRRSGHHAEERRTVHRVRADQRPRSLHCWRELKVTKDQLLANKALLTRVLTYHVLAAKVPAASVPVGKTITTVETGVFKIESTGGLKITDESNRVSNITMTDMPASNGVIHVIDKVLLPSDKDIVATAQSVPDFSILVEAVVAAGLVTTLQGPGPFTVFAPTNAAFAAALTELGVTKDALFANTALLTKVLTYHVVAARVLKAEVPIGKPITSVQGETFTIDASLKITDQRARVAGISATDVFASNGVIHVIDKVILPKP